MELSVQQVLRALCRSLELKCPSFLSPSLTEVQNWKVGLDWDNWRFLRLSIARQKKRGGLEPFGMGGNAGSMDMYRALFEAFGIEVEGKKSSLVVTAKGLRRFTFIEKGLKKQSGKICEALHAWKKEHISKFQFIIVEWQSLLSENSKT